MKIYIEVFTVSCLIAVCLGFIIIPILKKLNIGQNILGYVSEHAYKSGTPTMGGIIFVLSCIISFFIFAYSNRYLSYVSLAVGVSYMCVGFIDDFIKIKLHRNEGLSPVQKTLFEILIATIIAFFAYYQGLTKIYLPFSKKVVDFGWLYIPLSIFVFLATTNSVNLTDGLDGLAGGVSYIYLIIFATILLLQIEINSNMYISLEEYKNLAIICFALSGGIVGYLLFNTYKASVFMGDTGSLSIGGFIAVLAMLSGNLLFIPIIGITYVLSSISVIVQVLHYKRTKKRVFLMAPLHHHFQHKGYNETKIVYGYKLVTFIIGAFMVLLYL